jgi:hypothetical protein
MKTRTQLILYSAIALLAVTAVAGKKIVRYIITDTSGVNGKISFDERGNLVKVSPVFTNLPVVGNCLWEIGYKAYSKKGQVYSQGLLPDVQGLKTYSMPLFLSQGVGGFDNRMLLMKFTGNYVGARGASADFHRYIMFKLGNDGAELVNQIDFAVSNGFTAVYMYKGKVVSQFGEYSSNGLVRFTISIYNSKLVKNKRAGGTIMAQNGAWLGKAAAFLTYSGGTTCWTDVVKP